ncbi:unnamed protein product [Closterium sp. NIES-54]
MTRSKAQPLIAAQQPLSQQRQAAVAAVLHKGTHKRNREGGSKAVSPEPMAVLNQAASELLAVYWLSLPNPLSSSQSPQQPSALLQQVAVNYGGVGAGAMGAGGVGSEGARAGGVGTGGSSFGGAGAGGTGARGASSGGVGTGGASSGGVVAGGAGTGGASSGGAGAGGTAFSKSQPLDHWDKRACFSSGSVHS